MQTNIITQFKRISGLSFIPPNIHSLFRMSGFIYKSFYDTNFRIMQICLLKDCYNFK